LNNNKIILFLFLFIYSALFLFYLFLSLSVLSEYTCVVGFHGVLLVVMLRKAQTALPVRLTRRNRAHPGAEPP